jgi:hypothetical protein
MLRKLLLSVLLTIPVIGLASPHQEERRQFCELAAKNANAAAQARQVLKMPVEDFEQRALMYFASLIQSGEFTDDQINVLMEAILDGWNSGKSPEEAAQQAFQSCLARESI